LEVALEERRGFFFGRGECGGEGRREERRGDKRDDWIRENVVFDWVRARRDRKGVSRVSRGIGVCVGGAGGIYEEGRVSLKEMGKRDGKRGRTEG
jgi:hypothetical protein